MVKICPSCGAKNFNDARFCMKCTADIKNAQVVQVESKVKLSDEDVKGFQGVKPRGYTPQPWQGRMYSNIGNAFVGIYFIFLAIALFLFPLPVIVFIMFSFLAIIFGVLGIINGDKVIGILPIIGGIVTFLITVIIILVL